MSNACPFCGQADSRSHRILDCTGLSVQRQILSSETIETLRNNSTFRHFGLTTLDTEFTNIRQQFPATLSWHDLKNRFSIQHFDPDHEYHLFTDGSCFHNGDPFLAVAASSVVVYQNYLQHVQDCYTRSLLLGQDHSSYRAEIFAYYICCVQFTRGVIYSDCQSAIDDFIYILYCIAENREPVFHDHCDLWSEIYKIACHKGCTFRLVKVKAHCESMQYTSTDLWWKSQANAVADLQAKNAITIDNQGLYDRLVHFFSIRENLRKSSAEVMSFQVSVAWKAIHLNSARVAVETEPTVFGKGVVPEHVTWWPNILLEGQCQACKFNPIFLFRLAQGG